VNLSGLIPSCCIHWKSCIAFSGCPSFTHFLSFFFRAKMFNCTVPGAISPATQVRFCWSWIQSASYVSSCLTSDIFHWPTTRNPDHADDPCIPHPRHK
jgi:hypothetical protein